MSKPSSKLYTIDKESEKFWSRDWTHRSVGTVSVHMEDWAGSIIQICFDCTLNNWDCFSILIFNCVFLGLCFVFLFWERWRYMESLSTSRKSNSTEVMMDSTSCWVSELGPQESVRTSREWLLPHGNGAGAAGYFKRNQKSRWLCEIFNFKMPRIS